MTQPDPVRWGILATGGIAQAFAEDLAQLADAQMLAVGSRSAASAEAFAHAHGIPRAYGSWQELADDPDLDVIYIATPHNAHHAAASICLQAGKAVLCEKPFTLDSAEAEDLFAQARAADVFVMEAMWMRINPVIQAIHELVAAGAIGEVTHVGADFGLQGPIAPGHRLRARELGGGATLDLGVYTVAFAQLFLGVPDTIHAVASLTPEGTDQNTAILLGYESGALATLQCGFVGATAHRAVITGTAGRVEVPRHFHHPSAYTLVRDDGTRDGSAETVELTIRGRGLGYQAEEVMRCLRAGLKESPLIPHSATLEVLRTLDEVRAQIGVSYD
jgi:predicted dehydrogenase